MKINDAEKLLVVLLQVAIEKQEYMSARLLSSPGMGKSTHRQEAAVDDEQALGVSRWAARWCGCARLSSRM